MTRADDLRVHADRNRRLGEQLAARLASNAETTADHVDRLAELHEAIAGSEHHPLRPTAQGNAVRERRFAKQERRAAAVFRQRASPAGSSELADPGQ